MMFKLVFTVAFVHILIQFHVYGSDLCKNNFCEDMKIQIEHGYDSTKNLVKTAASDIATMATNNVKRSEEFIRDQTEAVKEKFESLKETTDKRLHVVKDSIHGALASTHDVMMNTVEFVNEKGADVKDWVGKGTHTLHEKVAEGVTVTTEHLQHVSGNTKLTAQKIKEQTEKKVDTVWKTIADSSHIVTSYWDEIVKSARNGVTHMNTAAMSIYSATIDYLNSVAVWVSGYFNKERSEL